MVLAPPSSPVTQYALSVVRGDTVAGKLVRQACQRHLDDLEHGHERGLVFDERAAQQAIDFFGFLPHIKGEWAKPGPKGQPSTLILQPWQQFMVGSIFGWKRADGLRRFRTVYGELPRKNGKSTMCAGIGLKLAFLDGEPGAEVYAAATKRDQAKIVWGDARAMVVKTPQLRNRIRALVGNLHRLDTASKFEPLGADSDTMDGLNIHGAIVDELHAHPSRKVVDVLETATGSRRQPMIVYITTAGYDRNSVCWQTHDYAARVLDGLVQDDTFFAYIATCDEGDDWRSPETWAKANPNFGVSVYPDDLRRKCERAQQIPAEQNAFLRLHLNVWTEQASRWLDLDTWDAGAVPVNPDDLVGRECYAGLDLSSRVDLTSLVLVFPDDEGGFDVLPYFWIPAEGMRRAIDRDRVPYDVWAREGYVEATEGNRVDRKHVELRVFELARRYDIREIAIDMWNAEETSQELAGEGLTVVPFGQGYRSMSTPAKDLEGLILDAKIRHGGHPVLRWCAANVTIEQDPAGNIKPSKAKSNGRIDGIVALTMAIGRALAHQFVSVYEDRDPFSIWDTSGNEQEGGDATDG